MRLHVPLRSPVNRRFKSSHRSRHSEFTEFKDPWQRSDADIRIELGAHEASRRGLQSEAELGCAAS
eukprot:3021608-Prymnesium_polylepis.1